MYDYRNDVIKLMQKTQGTKQSLDQSIVALDILLKVYRDQTNKKDNKDELSNEEEHPSIDRLSVQKQILTESNREQGIKNDDSDSKVEKDEPKDTEPSSDSVKLKIIKKNHDFENLKSDEFRIKRRMSGAIAVNSQNEQIAYFSEQEVRDHDIKNHDIVQLGGLDDLHEHTYIVNVIHDYKPYELVEFGPATVERHLLDNTLVVQRDLNNHQLSIENTTHSIYKIPFEYSQTAGVKEGDDVLLVWNRNVPENIKIRWIYHNSPASNESAYSYSKSRNKEKESKTKDTDYQPTLKFDLNGQAVGLFTADDSIMSNLQKVVEAHNGKPSIVALKSGAVAKDQTQKYDIIILMQSYIKHSVSQNAIAEAKASGTKIAMAQSAGQLSVEKALYRADNGLNVVDSPVVNYLAIDKN